MDTTTDGHSTSTVKALSGLQAQCKRTSISGRCVDFTEALRNCGVNLHECRIAHGMANTPKMHECEETKLRSQGSVMMRHDSHKITSLRQLGSCPGIIVSLRFLVKTQCCSKQKTFDTFFTPSACTDNLPECEDESYPPLEDRSLKVPPAEAITGKCCKMEMFNWHICFHLETLWSIDFGDNKSNLFDICANVVTAFVPRFGPELCTVMKSGLVPARIREILWTSGDKNWGLHFQFELMVFAVCPCWLADKGW